MIKRAPGNVRYLEQFGEHILTRNITARDPKRSSGYSKQGTAAWAGYAGRWDHHEDVSLLLGSPLACRRNIITALFPPPGDTENWETRMPSPRSSLVPIDSPLGVSLCLQVYLETAHFGFLGQGDHHPQSMPASSTGCLRQSCLRAGLH